MAKVSIKERGEKSEELEYKVGDFFKNKKTGEVYLVCEMVTRGEFYLFCINDGEVWQSEISHSPLETFYGSENDFEFISGQTIEIET